MKKLISTLLLTGCILCACSQKQENAPTEITAPIQTTAATAATAESEAISLPVTTTPITEPQVNETTENQTVPPETEEAEIKPDLRAAAVSLIDAPVDELYAAIGYPKSSEYAPSCLVSGEDGMLYYDGFIVYTLKTSSGETVYDVE